MAGNIASAALLQLRANSTTENSQYNGKENVPPPTVNTAQQPATPKLVRNAIPSPVSPPATPLTSSLSSPSVKQTVVQQLSSMKLNLHDVSMRISELERKPTKERTQTKANAGSLFKKLASVIKESIDRHAYTYMKDYRRNDFPVHWFQTIKVRMI